MHATPHAKRRTRTTGLGGYLFATLLTLGCDSNSPSSSNEADANDTPAAPCASNLVPSSASDPPATGSVPTDPNSLCDNPELVWRSAHKTNYESYPDPGSEECIEFNGCEWEGQFAACDGKKPEAWVEAHNIVAAFPDFGSLQLHDLCLRRANNTIVVTVLDTCADSDCDGCCTQNQAGLEQLIDLEHYTNERWGEPDGRIEWADLGPTRGGGCE